MHGSLVARVCVIGFLHVVDFPPATLTFRAQWRAMCIGGDPDYSCTRGLAAWDVPSVRDRGPGSA